MSKVFSRSPDITILAMWEMKLRQTLKKSMATDIETKYEFKRNWSKLTKNTVIATLSRQCAWSKFLILYYSLVGSWVGLRYFYANEYLLLSAFFLSFHDAGDIDFSYAEESLSRVEISGYFDAPRSE